MLYRIVKTLLFPPDEESQGNGSATRTSTESAPITTPPPANEYNPGFAKDENSANRDTLPPVDWDAEAKKGTSIEDFKNAGRVVKDEKKSADEKPNTETGKEGTTEVETEVQESEEVQVDDTPEGRRVTGEDANKQTNVNQQVEEDPVLKAYPEVVPFLKKMDKSARQFVKAKLAEKLQVDTELSEAKNALTLAQQGRSVVPPNYYENPHAYLLLPEFHQTTKDISIANQIYNYWKGQKLAILNGQEWEDVQDLIDPTTKQLVGVKGNGKKLPADGTAQAMVDEQLEFARQQLQEAQQGQQQIVQGFQHKVRQLKEVATKAENDLFPPDKWNTDKTPEGKIVAQTKAALKNFGFTEANPLYSITAKLAAQVMLLKDYVNTTNGKAAKAKSIADSTRRAGPTGNVTQGAGGAQTSNADEDVAASFERLKTQVRY